MTKKPVWILQSIMALMLVYVGSFFIMKYLKPRFLIGEDGSNALPVYTVPYWPLRYLSAWYRCHGDSSYELEPQRAIFEGGNRDEKLLLIINGRLNRMHIPDECENSVNSIAERLDRGDAVFYRRSRAVITDEYYDEYYDDYFEGGVIFIAPQVIKVTK